MTQRLPLTVYMVIVPKAILQWYVYREYEINSDRIISPLRICAFPSRNHNISRKSSRHFYIWVSQYKWCNLRDVKWNDMTRRYLVEICLFCSLTIDCSVQGHPPRTKVRIQQTCWRVFHASHLRFKLRFG